MSVYIIPTKNSEHLLKNFENKKGIKILFPGKNKDNKSKFPDGELYSKLSVQNVAAKYVVLHSGMPEPNEGLVELEMILQILKRQKVKNISIFFSYFPFGMQDDIFAVGETNVAEDIISKLVKYHGVKRIFVLDAHFYKKSWVKKYPIINIPINNYLIKIIKKKYTDIIFISPDSGGERRTGLKSFKKTRHNSYKIDLRDEIGLKKIVKHKTVCIVDDIVETGGTLLKAEKKCRQYEAHDVVTLITHGVLKTGIKKITNHFSKVYLTNSINNKIQKVMTIDILPLILKIIASNKYI